MEVIDWRWRAARQTICKSVVVVRGKNSLSISLTAVAGCPVLIHCPLRGKWQKRERAMKDEKRGDVLLTCPWCLHMGYWEFQRIVGDKLKQMLARCIWRRHNSSSVSSRGSQAHPPSIHPSIHATHSTRGAALEAPSPSPLFLKQGRRDCLSRWQGNNRNGQRWQGGIRGKCVRGGGGGNLRLCKVRKQARLRGWAG